jgi:maltose O-acetyltransferase
VREIETQQGRLHRKKHEVFDPISPRILALLLAAHRAAVIFIAKLLGAPFVVSYLRNPSPEISAALLRRFGAKIGPNSTIKRSLLLDNVYEDANSTGTLNHLDVGSNCYIGDDVYIDLSNYVIIGDDTMISGRVSFVTHADCHRSEFLHQRFSRRCAPFHIGSGVWIGFGATILHGVTIGENAVIGAGSVVRTDVPAGEMWAGIPAKCIRTLV